MAGRKCGRYVFNECTQGKRREMSHWPPESNQLIPDFTFVIVVVVPKTTLPEWDDWPWYFQAFSKTADEINGLRHQNTPSWPACCVNWIVLLLWTHRYFFLLFSFYKFYVFRLWNETGASVLTFSSSFHDLYQRLSIKKASRRRASTGQRGSARANFTSKISLNLVRTPSVTMATALTETFFSQDFRIITQGRFALR